VDPMVLMRNSLRLGVVKPVLSKWPLVGNVRSFDTLPFEALNLKIKQGLRLIYKKKVEDRYLIRL
jgi:hypothetical protein